MVLVDDGICHYGPVVELGFIGWGAGEQGEGEGGLTRDTRKTK